MVLSCFGSGFTRRNASFSGCGMFEKAALFINSHSCGCVPSRFVTDAYLGSV